MIVFTCRNTAPQGSCRISIGGSITPFAFTSENTSDPVDMLERQDEGLIVQPLSRANHSTSTLADDDTQIIVVGAGESFIMGDASAPNNNTTKPATNTGYIL
jgi:hypothetical protein